jgi:hypothetical protein
MKKCIVVTGMHRSGTSVCAASLSSLNIFLGDVDKYRDEENPNGYFENFDIVGLNDRILQHYDVDWFSPISPIHIDVEDLSKKGYIKQGVELVSNYFKSANAVAFKDPRVSLLLPFWKAVFSQFDDLEVSYVLMLRCPEEVAKSQATRHQHNPSFFHLGKEKLLTELVWYEYNLNFAGHIDGERAMAIFHHNFLQQPEQQINRIGEFVGLTPDANKLSEFLEQTFSRKLYRSEVQTSIKPKSVFESLYQSLAKADSIETILSIIRKTELSLDYHDICPGITELSSKVCTIQQDIRQIYQSDVNLLQSEVDKLKELLKQERKQHKETDTGLSNLTQLLEKERSEHKNAMSVISTLEKLLGDERRHHKEALLGLDNLEKLLGDERCHHKEALSGLANLEKLFFEQQEQLKQTDKALASLQKQFLEQQQQLQQTDKALASEITLRTSLQAALDESAEKIAAFEALR